jgi:hypothetical protein
VSFDVASPAALWGSLDPSIREQAARSVYSGETVPPTGRAEADAAIAAAIRFRPNAVRRLPVERRIGYLLKAVRVDDGLASTLLLALHLDRRVELLETFLARLGIPNEGGLIDDAYELTPPEPAALAPAVAELRERFAADEVELYLASLRAIDPETWAGLAEVSEPSGPSGR